MDLSQYAELFLAESREHLSACNQLLLEWERAPASPAPVGGLFRAVHTVKGMAATMGYARVTDLAHRAENLLDLLRRGGRPATDELLQLLFRSRDALEHAVELSVVGREDELDVAEVVADLESAAALIAGPERAAPGPPPTTAVEAPAAPGGGRLVQVTLRAEAPLKGGRALLALKRAQALGAVQAVTPPQAGFEIVGEAETGSQAVEKYRQLKPDLVTMDIVMPDMGGIDAVREIVKQDPDAKILMCSAMGQQALVVEAIQAGAKDFVVKPFQPSRVLEAVQRVLG